jgi:PBSX family phage terminase large subunit
MKTFEPNKTILFTRYTMTSAEISIIPEFWEKVEMLHLEDKFTRTQNSITNLLTGSVILFRGLKASSGKQTANLKSINNITTWVLDEAEEMTDEDMFDKIDLSVRKKGEANEVILVLNPTDITHMIYRKFFKKYGLVNVINGVVGDCTYIHTTYLDNKENLDQTFLDLAEKMRLVDEDKYKNVFLGHFAEQAAGLIFKNWTKGKFPDNLTSWYGVDWGFSNDPTAVDRLCYDKSINTLYIKEVCYQRGLLNNEIAAYIRNDYRNKRTFLYSHEDIEIYSEHGKIIANKGTEQIVVSMVDFIANNQLSDFFGCVGMITKSVINLHNVLTEVYCDPSRPEHIKEMRVFYGLSTMAAVNAKKVERIEFLKYFNVVYEGDNIETEVNGYKWMPKKKTDDGREPELQNEPMDGNDHHMDAINYGAVTHLRRLGISNLIGEK